MPSTGLVFLDDLHGFAPWIADRAPAWAAERRLSGPLLAPVVAPPPGVVVVMREAAWEQLVISVGWLRLAERIVIVCERSGDGALAGDPEVQELVRLERAQLAAALGNAVRFVDVDAPGLDAAIERALAAVGAASPVAWPALASLDPVAAVAPGAWLAWRPPAGDRHTPEEVDAIRHLAAALCAGGGRPALLDAVTGTRIDLSSGAAVAVHGLAGSAERWRPIAASPDGTRWLTTGGRPQSWTLGDSPGCPGGWGQPIAIEPGGRMAWGGGRCWFHWRAITAHGAVYWTPSAHDWPVGHAKKLYGHEDNEPLIVQLSPDASTCLSIYEHDALVTPGLPLRWRDVGGFALAERARGEPRVLVFERDAAWAAAGGDDEDIRGRFATVTLGPSPELRYVVGLTDETHRLTGGALTRLGDPSGGWIVCDDHHRIVRRGDGRLLAGWHRWVVIEQAGRLRRDDLISGSCEDLGAVDRPIDAAVAIAGSPNAVLYSHDPGAVRVV